MGSLLFYLRLFSTGKRWMGSLCHIKEKKKNAHQYAPQKKKKSTAKKKTRETAVVVRDVTNERESVGRVLLAADLECQENKRQ